MGVKEQKDGGNEPWCTYFSSQLTWQTFTKALGSFFFFFVFKVFVFSLGIQCQD